MGESTSAQARAGTHKLNSETRRISRTLENHVAPLAQFARKHRVTLLISLILSAMSAALGVAAIAFVNDRILAPSDGSLAQLGRFVALLLGLLGVGAVSRITLTTLGHRAVADLRATLVKRVLDTDIERLETLGLSRVLTSLSTDVAHLTAAFVALPNASYGVLLTIGGFGYLAWLSPALFAVTLAWIGLTVAIGAGLMGATQRALTTARDAEDRLVADYQAVVDGRKELALNRKRAQLLFESSVLPNAYDNRDHEIRADVFHGINENLMSTMVLGAVGLSFFLGRSLHWVPDASATTYALTILFLRTPITSLVSALPALVAGKVAMQKIAALELAAYQPTFTSGQAVLPSEWRSIALRGLRYRHAGSGDQGFEVGPIDLTLQRGELVFLIGGNGSGKTTLLRMLTSLYTPHAGTLSVDDLRIDEAHRSAYRELFSGVFSDYHLFDQLLGAAGETADLTEVLDLLERLELADKVVLRDGRIADTLLSAGQRKRLALLLALIEKRAVLVLDEWAADQDPSYRHAFYCELLPAFRRAGLTVFAITHDDHYFHVADRVLKADGGKLIELTETQRKAPLEGRRLRAAPVFSAE